MTKKVSTTGRFGSRYGKRIRELVVAVEKKQRKRQKCPYCKKNAVKRIAKGIWGCKSCKKTFSGGAYYLE